MSGCFVRFLMCWKINALYRRSHTSDSLYVLCVSLTVLPVHKNCKRYSYVHYCSSLTPIGLLIVFCGLTLSFISFSFHFFFFEFIAATN